MTEATATDRQTEILASIDSLIAEHDRWSGSEWTGPIPPESFSHAVTETVRVIEAGRIPPPLYALTERITRFADRWRRYRAGDVDYIQHPSRAPAGRTWTELKNAIHLRRNLPDAVQPQPQPIVEPSPVAQGAAGRELPIVGDSQGGFVEGPPEAPHCGLADDSPSVESAPMDGFELDRSPGPEPAAVLMAAESASPMMTATEPDLATVSAETSTSALEPRPAMPALASRDAKAADATRSLSRDGDLVHKPAARPDSFTLRSPLSHTDLSRLVLELHASERELGPSAIAERISKETREFIDSRTVNGILLKARREESAV